MFKITKIINLIGIGFLIFAWYGLPVTGVLQVFASILFVFQFPKNKLIYFYFGLVITFFCIWDRNSFDWLFSLPIFLIGFLTYVIYTQKNEF